MAFARMLVPALLIAVLSACAPALFRLADGPSTFALTVDGVPVPATDDAFVLSGDGYDVEVRLAQAFVTLIVDNRSAAPVRVVPQGSRWVLADGSVSAAVTTAFLTAGEGGTDPIDVDPGSQGGTSLFPVDRVRRSGAHEPIFPWPLTEPTTFSLTLAIEEVGAVRTRVLVFAADGPEAR